MNGTCKSARQSICPGGSQQQYMYMMNVAAMGAFALANRRVEVFSVKSAYLDTVITVGENRAEFLDSAC